MEDDKKKKYLDIDIEMRCKRVMESLLNELDGEIIFSVEIGESVCSKKLTWYGNWWAFIIFRGSEYEVGVRVFTRHHSVILKEVVLLYL